MDAEESEAKMREICEKVLQEAVPSEKEKRETLRFSENLVKTLEKKLKEARLEAQVQIEGSIAKDTWLAGEKDIDIFILLPKTCKREDFAEVLTVVKKACGEKYLEAYAEHPYIEAKIEGFTVDFVPCFKIEKADDAASSVDRTPLHTLYVKNNLSSKIKDEIRLLKRFMRGIGTYGAEIKVGGFSGYLCEILVLHYGSFLKLLNAASNWRRGQLIDIEKYYEDRWSEAKRIFQEPLIVIDPVDKGRNIASSVRIDKLNEFIAASREFLKHPSLSFFYPKNLETLTADELIRAFRMRGSAFVFLKTNVVAAVPDVLWGQLYKSQKAIRNLIIRQDFKLIRDAVWSDEENTSIFLFELYSRVIPVIERHVGPQIEKKEDCERFLKKHLNPQQILAGPRIEHDRWVVERKRRYFDVAALLQDKLRDGGTSIGIAGLVSKAFSSSFEIWVDDEIKDFYSENTSFAAFLTEYLKGRPKWLEQSNG